MVTIKNYEQRQTAKGDVFYALILHGDLEMIQSTQTGRFYATARKCSITSTFDEETCKTLIGKTLPGVIEKVECEPYAYVIEGEVVELTHTYEYKPNASDVSHQPIVDGLVV